MVNRFVNFIPTWAEVDGGPEASTLFYDDVAGGVSLMEGSVLGQEGFGVPRCRNVSLWLGVLD